jgi:hypothetical protein
MHARNAGLQRLRSVTRRVGIVATVLTGIFAGLAAASNSGQHRRAVAKPRSPGRAPSTNANRTPPPPSLPPLASGSGAPFDQSQSPAGPAQPPVQTQAPPVVTSGGS